MALLASCWNAEMRSAGAWPELVIEIDAPAHPICGDGFG
jgi:hypothetical protein